MSIAELKTLLANIPGDSFSLTATQLGVDSVAALFKDYVPQSTLTLGNPKPDVAGLQVSGQMTVGSAVNAPTVVTFLADPTNTSVAGINIKLGLASWTFTAPFADFSGDALQGFGFTAPQLVLSAGDISLAAGSPAAFFGGALNVTGTTGTKTAILSAQIPFDTPTSRAGIASNYVFEVELEDVTLADLNALTQFIPGAKFDIIPTDVIPLADSFALKHIEFVVDSARNQLVSLRLSVGSAKGLTVVADVFEITSFTFSFLIVLPGVATQAYGVVATTLDVFGQSIDVALSLPDLYLFGSLGHDHPVPLKPFVSKFLPANIVPDDFQLSALDFGLGLEAPHNYVFDITLSNLWSVTIGTREIEMTSLSVYLNGAGGGAPGLSIQGQIAFSGTLLYLSAENQQGSPNWSFKGGTVDAGTVAFPGFEPSGLKIGDLLDDLGQSFGIDVPASVKSLVLKNIQLSFDTGTETSFHFLCTGQFTVEDTPVILTVKIDITKKDGAAPSTSQYDAKFGGEIRIGTLQFDLVFDHENLQSDTFIASYSHTDGDPDTISLHDLVAGISDQLAEAIPDGIEIQLKDVKFVFFRKDTSKQFAFGLDLALSIDLSHLPVVGSRLPAGLSLNVNDLQGVYSSKPFSADQIGTINTLLPSSVTPFPGDGLSQGINLTADVQLGSESKHLVLGVPQKQTGGGASLAPAATTGNTPAPHAGTVPPSTPSSTMKWINVQKQFGIFQFDRIGAGYSGNILSFALDAAVSLGPLTFSMDGLSVGSSIKKFDPVFDLTGLGLDFKKPPLEIGGAFLKTQEQVGDKTINSYYGEVIVKTANFSIKAIGGWAPDADPASFFLYANLEAPLGGPPFLFVTGLAGGFGINRTLKLPTIDQISGYLLLPNNAPQPAGSPTETIATVLPQLQTIFVEQPGEYWVAAGIQFTSFEMIQAFVLLTVAFGVDLQIAVLGTCEMTLPTGDPFPVAYIEVDLIASFTPSTGLLAVDGKLSPASFIYGGFCKLSGGFAFYTWFSGRDKGNFVVTAGGYHPAFTKPDIYPSVPRLQMNFGLGPFQVTGQAYFALTPSMMMAGIRLSAVWNSGPVKAWLDAGVDFLISWAPFHYEADVFINIGCSVDLGLFTLSVHVGADLTIWGPPFGGRAHVDLDVVSFTISFGADPATPPPVGWNTFKIKFLPQPSASQTKVQQPVARPMALATVIGADVPESTNIIKASVPTGLLQSDVSGFNWILDSDHFSILTNSTIPANNGEWALSASAVATLPNTVSSYNPVQVDVTAGPYLTLPATTQTFSTTQVWNPTVHIGPMGQDNVQSFQTVQVCKRRASDPVGDFSDFITELAVTPVLLPSTTALWGQNNPNKTPNDPLLVPAALTGFLITPIPRTPAQVNDVPLIQLLFAEGFSTGFRYQPAAIDPNFTATSTINTAEDLIITIEGGHAATLTNQNFILSALTDQWVTSQRASIVDDLAANGFATHKSTEIDLTIFSGETSLTDWPAVKMMGS
jgi:hypothetical protein